MDKNGKSDRKFFGLSPSYPVELFLSKRMTQLAIYIASAIMGPLASNIGFNVHTQA